MIVPMVRISGERHLPPHRAWAYLHHGGELAAPERDHILQCETCLHLFQICLKAESFGAVLADLGIEFREQRSA
jgi:hypothetical protein